MFEFMMFILKAIVIGVVATAGMCFVVQFSITASEEYMKNLIGDIGLNPSEEESE